MMEKDILKRTHIHTHIYICTTKSLCCITGINDNVNQQYFNKNKKRKWIRLITFWYYLLDFFLCKA